MSEEFRKFRRNIIIGILIKFALIVMLWFVFARGVLTKKAEGEPSGQPSVAGLMANPRD